MNELIEERIKNAKAIAWDTCHKIYLLMDEEQVNLMHEYGYEDVVTANQATPEEMLRTLAEWYDDSCGLRFIQAVSTNHTDPNAGFESLIPQSENGYWEKINV